MEWSYKCWCGEQAIAAVTKACLYCGCCAWRRMLRMLDTEYMGQSRYFCISIVPGYWLIVVFKSVTDRFTVYSVLGLAFILLQGGFALPLIWMLKRWIFVPYLDASVLDAHLHRVLHDKWFEFFCLNFLGYLFGAFSPKKGDGKARRTKNLNL